MAEKKVKQYVSNNTQLMAEWDWDKNADIDPSQLTIGSHTKVWWTCSNGHEWQSAISKRTIGQNCPFCSGKKAWKGYNDLSTTNPELVTEWDFDKNDVPIYEYRPMSNKKVWWICANGHRWSAAISKRVSGEKCPICQGKQILIGFNDLATTHPALALEWDYEKNDYLTPQNVSKGSMNKVWWKCCYNHTWQATIASRVSGVGCPHCAKELQSSFPEKAIFFYIKQMFPDAIANYHSERLSTIEIDVFIPSVQIGIEYDGERWHRSIEKDMNKNKLCAESGILLIRVREPGCPILSDTLSICIIRESKKTGLGKTITNLLLAISKIVGAECYIDVDLEKDNSAILELLNPLEKKIRVYLKSLKIHFLQEK